MALAALSESLWQRRNEDGLSPNAKCFFTLAKMVEMVAYTTFIAMSLYALTTGSLLSTTVSCSLIALSFVSLMIAIVMKKREIELVVEERPLSFQIDSDLHTPKVISMPLEATQEAQKELDDLRRGNATLQGMLSRTQQAHKEEVAQLLQQIEALKVGSPKL